MPESLITPLFSFYFDPNPAASGDSPAGGIMQMLMLFGPVFLLFYLMILRPNQQRERQRKAMLAAIKRNDHVVTVGGVKGVVTNVLVEEDEVVIRVDEATGTKLRVDLKCISSVASGAGDADESKKES